MRRNLPAAVAVMGAAGIAAAAVGSAASIAVSSEHLTSFSAAGPTSTPPPSDTTAPTAVLSVFDDDLDGKLDRITADFDEALGSTCTATAWTVTHGAITPTLTVTGPDANHVVTLTWNDTALPVDTTNATIKVSLTSGPGGYCDAAGNQATITNASPGDKAAPALVSMLMRDVRVDGTAGNVRGRIDQVDLTFSEDLAAYSAGTTGWTLTDVPSAGALASVERDATNVRLVRLTLTEGAGALDTAVRNFKVRLAQTANGVRDAADNRSSFGQTSPTDGAGPVPRSLTINNGTGTPGTADQGDTIAIVFSEILSAQSVCSGFSASTTASQEVSTNNTEVSIHNGGSSSNDVLRVTVGSPGCPVLRFGEINLGGTGFVTGTSTTAVARFVAPAEADRSKVQWNPTTETLTITLGKQSGSTTPAAGGSTQAIYTPVAGITDTVSPTGNAIGGTVSSTRNHF